MARDVLRLSSIEKRVAPSQEPIQGGGKKMALSKRRAGGFSLLEVLVAIVVLSVGLLGAMSMLMASVRSATESGSFTAAVNLVRDLSEKARVNKHASTRDADANPYLLDLKSGDPLPGASSAGCAGAAAQCGADDLAAWDVHHWVQRARNMLPEAHVVVCFDDEPVDTDGNAGWPCSDTGRNLVVKLGWRPRLGSEDEMDEGRRTPRVVMQLVPGQAYDGA
ncbi:type IV pilus modification protein PilV [Variovorax sp. GT1P44]|uniref:type IV pilus modification protein PilV n=1 Tax=Variovorax sp. GT1P44 TaxID=3443742 RepID=UPI003F489955